MICFFLLFSGSNGVAQVWKAFAGGFRGFSGGSAYRSTTSPRSFSILTVVWVVRRGLVVLVAVEEADLSIRGRSSLEVAIVKVFRTGSGLCARNLPARPPPSLKPTSRALVQDAQSKVT